MILEIGMSEVDLVQMRRMELTVLVLKLSLAVLCTPESLRELISLHFSSENCFLGIRE